LLYFSLTGNRARIDTIGQRKSMSEPITSLDQIVELWKKTYNAEGKVNYTHILPYYAEDIHFRDSVQELHGIDNFREMTERLSERSQELEMNILRAAMEGRTVFLEWEMSIIFKNRPKSIIYGMSRVTLNENGMIAEQRDYYDLWGDIFDNVPFFAKTYRKFMRKKFG